MKTHTRWIAGLLVGALLAWTLAATTQAATYKHKKTGETITGTMTEQRAGKTRVFKSVEGYTRFIDPAEWKLVEADPPPAKPAPKAKGPATKSPEPVTPETPAGLRAFIIPISGPIAHSCLVEGIEKALGEAKQKGATVLVFRMNTPGGYVYVADKVIRAIEGVDWAETVSWIEGEDKQALSAGAYICLATHRIFMEPGATIGAATPYRTDESGAPDVDEKFVSAFRARFRSLAQQQGHPSVIADAMVDRSVAAVHVTLDGKSQVVTEEEAERLEKQHASDKTFKRGKTITKSGKLLTMTSQEAVEYGVCAGIAGTSKELLKHLGDADGTITEATWLPAWVKGTAERREKKVDEYRAQFNQHLRQAVELDPRAQTYTVIEGRRTFSDGGLRWRDFTDQCLAHLKKCATALTGLERLAKDPRYDFPVPQRILDDMKRDMETMYKRLHQQRNFVRLP